MNEPLLVSRREAAEALGISLRKLDSLISTREISTRRIGRRTLIPLAALRQFSRRDHVIKGGKRNYPGRLDEESPLIGAPIMSSMNSEVTYVVWIDENGNEWNYEAVGEQCEFGDNGADCEHLLSGDDPPEPTCLEPVEYVGRVNGRLTQLCRAHFETTVKPHCTEKRVPF